MYTLYTTPLSANGRKTVALSHHLGVQPEVVDVNVYRGEGQRAEFLAVNPWGKVPTLVDDTLTLWESNAILQYISEAYGDFRSWAREPGPRANIARWLFWESAHWQPVLTSVIAQHVGHVLRPNDIEEPEAAPPWGTAALSGLLRQLEQQLQHSGYVAGDGLSIADFSVAALTMFFGRLGFPFETYPAFHQWYQRIHALPAWRATSVEPWAP